MESVNIAIRHGDAKSLGSSFTQLLYQERYLQRRDGSALSTVLSGSMHLCNLHMCQYCLFNCNLAVAGSCVACNSLISRRYRMAIRA